MNIMRFAAYLIVGFMLGLALPSFAAWLLAKLAGRRVRLGGEDISYPAMGAAISERDPSCTGARDRL
jgi:hypothetical protein